MGSQGRTLAATTRIRQRASSVNACNSPQPPRRSRPIQVMANEPTQQDDRLGTVRVQHGAQAASNRVEPGQQHGRDGADPECVVRTAERVGEQGFENDGAGINRYGHLGQYVSGQ